MVLTLATSSSSSARTAQHSNICQVTYLRERKKRTLTLQVMRWSFLTFFCRMTTGEHILLNYRTTLSISVRAGNFNDPGWSQPGMMQKASRQAEMKTRDCLVWILLRSTWRVRAWEDLGLREVCFFYVMSSDFLFVLVCDLRWFFVIGFHKKKTTKCSENFDVFKWEAAFFPKNCWKVKHYFSTTGQLIFCHLMY